MAKLPLKKAENKVETKSDAEFKLPKYLRLAKGAMWCDTGFQDSSGVKLFATPTIMVGRGTKSGEENVPRDKFGNKNFLDYGYVDKDITEIQWYVDVSTIPPEKQSRLIMAYKYGILVEADPKKPPKPSVEQEKHVKDFAKDKNNELVFVGKNKEMFSKLQNLSVTKLRDFIATSPKNTTARNNLMDMFHYEKLGYNKLARPRLEVMDLIRAKLKEYGPSMSPIRVNDEAELPKKGN